jgi:hypothetical protein
MSGFKQGLVLYIELILAIGFPLGQWEQRAEGMISLAEKGGCTFPVPS